MIVEFTKAVKKVSDNYTKLGDVTIKYGESVAIRGCELVETKGKKWLKMPSRKYTSDGETRYSNYVTLSKDETDKVMTEINKAVKDDTDELHD